MSEQHTPERWEYREYLVYLGREGGFSLRAWPNAEADARRIVACVNACAGIETSYLEFIVCCGNTKQDMVDFIGMKKQRDELLAAVDAFANKYLLDERDELDCCFSEEHHEDVKSLFSAIAKAKGGAA